MNQIPVQGPPTDKRLNNLSPTFKILILLFILLPVVVLAFSFTVNRYGKFWQRQAPAPKSITPSLTPQTTLKIICPVPKEFCKQGKVVSDGEFSGVAFSLPLEATISAIFSGKLSDQPKLAKRPSSEPLLYLSAQGYEAIYSYFGTVSAKLPKDIKKGEIIGKIGKGNFPSVVSFSDSNFLFSIKKNGKFIPLTLENFE